MLTKCWSGSTQNYITLAFTNHFEHSFAVNGFQSLEALKLRIKTKRLLITRTNTAHSYNIEDRTGQERTREDKRGEERRQQRAINTIPCCREIAV